MNGRERLLALLEGREPDRLATMPITMMFAGDRIGVPYGKYAADARTLVEAQVHVAEEFDFDYVSAISDPAREAADCGASVECPHDQPPAIDEVNARLADKSELASLRAPEPADGARMSDRLEAIALLVERAGAERLVEGWVEGPCAESADLRGINRLMLDFIDDPAFVRDLFEFTLDLALRFARAQIDAGADIIGVGDAAASLVGPRIYEEFVWPYEKRLVDGIHAAGGRVRLHICGKTGAILGGMGRLGADIVDLDYFASLADGREAMGPDQVLLGNLDPVRALRDGSPESIRAALATCHREAGERYVVGAGCEITRDTAPENVHALVDFARSASR